MLHVIPSYAVNREDLEFLKKGASVHLPEVQPSHRMELLARALGARTYAALRARPSDASSLVPTDIPTALGYAKQRGIAVEPLDIHLALAFTILRRTARLLPDLHDVGYGRGCCQPARSEFAELRRTTPPAQFHAVVRERTDAIFDERRSALFESRQAHQTLRAIAFCASVRPTKAVGARAQSSYGLKHVAERLSYGLGDGVVLPAGYVANTDLIAAAVHGGLPIRHFERGSPNVGVGIFRRSMDLLRKERRAA